MTGSAATALATRSLRIGPLALDPPVVLAPMAGVTDGPFRRLCRRFGDVLTVSEMVTARALVEGNTRTVAMATFEADEPVRSVQLAGVDPKVMDRAVRILVDEVGVDHVDLNFGCPAAKVTRRGGGAALPVHRRLFASVVEAAVGAAGDIPVTVKLRLGVDDDNLTFVEAGRLAAGAGAAAVTLHARTAEQLYAGSAGWEEIAALRDALDGVPVLGNGDIWEAGDALAMVARTGCAGVVVGRGCLGRPWLFADLARAFAGAPPETPPTFGQVAAIMVDHAAMLVESFGPRLGILRFRKHAGWYVAGYPVGPELRRDLALVASLAGLAALLEGVDPALALPDEGRRVRRGHTGGPRPVQLPAGWLEAVDDPTPPAGADVLVSGG